MALPDASTKLRLVLDYVPCEACLAEPVDDQELLCGICARLDRQVAIRVSTRSSILVERPDAPEAPIVIPAAPTPAPLEAAPPALPEVVVRFAEEAPVERPGTIEVVVAPLGPEIPIAPAVALAEIVEDEGTFFSIDDIAEFTKARDEFFDYKKPPAYVPPPRAPEPEPEPEPVQTPLVAEPVPQDDFVFRAPAEEEPVLRNEPAEIVRDDIIPEEEVRVEPPAEEPEPWAPPSDFLAEEEVRREEPPLQEAPALEEEIIETSIVEEEEAIQETQLVEEEPEPAPEPERAPEPEPEPEPAPQPTIFAHEEEAILEMEPVAEEEPAPPPTGMGDLYRLRGFDGSAESALAKARISAIAHLSGHDAGELAQRTALPLSRLQPWIQVADLVQEVGVPVEAAVALVAAGVAGPKGLRDADPDEVADRATAFGGHTVHVRDVKRWKRRA